MSVSHSVTVLLEQWNPAIKLRWIGCCRSSMRNYGSCPSGTCGSKTLVIPCRLRHLFMKRTCAWLNRQRNILRTALFFGVAAQAMPHILVDYACARQTARRGGAARPISLEEAALVTAERAAELVALLRRVERRRNGYCTVSFAGDSNARLEYGQDPVTSRPECRK